MVNIGPTIQALTRAKMAVDDAVDKLDTLLDEMNEAEGKPYGSANRMDIIVHVETAEYEIYQALDKIRNIR